MSSRCPMRPVLIVLSLVFMLEVVISKNQPNIIFILTDDQDVYMNGTHAMQKTLSLLGAAGATFANMFVTTPLCCPSRSSILTGTYVHNHMAINNSMDGNCSSAAWQQGPEKNTMATFLQKAGYSTFFAGKYLNQYGDNKAGGVGHVPPGWDQWNGLVGNSVYYNYTLSVNGEAEVHGNDPDKDYLTDVIHRKAAVFLDDQLKPDQQPFFMMLSTPACHGPFTPHPKYASNFSDKAAPQTPNFNVHSSDKHWIVRNAKNPMGNESLTYVNVTFRNRWRTLLSVDDMVDDVVSKLKAYGALNNTYVIFASDNGFHLGQFSLPNDKRQMYEFDIRVPLMIRGPGIKPGVTIKNPVLNIDLTPTMLDLAGISAPSHMDGKSFRKILLAGGNNDTADDFLVEHTGEYNFKQPGCPQLDGYPLNNCFPNCVCEDSKNNTYLCVRRLSGENDLVYCGFADDEQYVEVYDLKSDPYQMTNAANTLDPQILESLEYSLANLALCKGSSCHGVRPRYSLPKPVKHDLNLNKPLRNPYLHRFTP